MRTTSPDWIGTPSKHLARLFHGGLHRLVLPQRDMTGTARAAQSLPTHSVMASPECDVFLEGVNSHQDTVG